MTQAINAFGTLLQRGDGATPEVFATVGEVTDLSGPSGDKDTIEATNHSSPSGYKEFIGGLKDGGEVSFTVNFVPKSPMSATLLADFEAPNTRNWQLVLPDGATAAQKSKLAWAGFVTHFEVATPVDNQMTAQLTIKVTGPTALTPGTP